MPSPRLTSTAIACAFAIASSAFAVVHITGDGSGNTTAPVDDFGFSQVGLVWDATDGVYVGGVYLGDGWVLSAYHGVRNGSGGFSLSTVTFGITAYQLDQTSGVRLMTVGQGVADLALFHMVGPYPALSGVTLSSSTPAVGSTLAMAGVGRNRDTVQTQWTVNTGPEPDVWTETGGTGDRQGFKYAGGATLRWGMNLRASNAVGNVDDGFGITRMFRTTFSNDGTAIADEAQAAPGDSGGGVFFKNGASWELSGIMLTTLGVNGQPVDTAVFGDQTLIADVASYRSQIVSTIPEPSGAALTLLASLFLGARRRR